MRAPAFVFPVAKKIWGGVGSFVSAMRAAAQLGRGTEFTINVPSTSQAIARGLHGGVGGGVGNSVGNSWL